MARAYIVLRRNDLDDNWLQVLDLVPNESLRNFPYDPAGQTHYVSHYLIDGVNLPVATTGAGPIAIDGDSYGLSTYLIDRVENTGTVNTPALTAAQALGISTRIEGIASVGGVFDATAIDAAINAEAGVTGAGLAVGNSSGSVEEVLRILAGERYKVPTGEVVADATPSYVPINPGVTRDGGFFTTAPNVEGPASVRNQYGPVRGYNPFTGGPTVQTTPPVQTGTEDVNHNFLRSIFDTGDLHRSAVEGALAELKATDFAFVNPDFSYSNVAPLGTALTLDGTNIPAGGAAPAIVIYAADGTVI